MTEHVSKHGDGVYALGLSVDDCQGIYNEAIKRGAISVEAPKVLEDEHGKAIVATIKTFGDTVHTFVQRQNYRGVFLPKFVAVSHDDPLSTLLPSPNLDYIDHCVANLPDGQMVEVCNWYGNYPVHRFYCLICHRYEHVLQFHRFWSVDDSQIHTEYRFVR
jgi:4-hydroxyphenylpyruvate dioxygenase